MDPNASASAIDAGAIVGVVIWTILISLVAWDEARRENPHADVDALAERHARELAGRDA